MDELEYKNFYDRVGEMNGWDFSTVKTVTEGEAWNFYDVVSERCKGSEVLLDIGTGGGEALLSAASSVLFAVGIDASAGMIQTATRNLRERGVTNIRFLRMDAEQLQFPGEFFDIVSCRQAPFAADEVFRVLREEGVFLTQQVCEGDKLNLKKAFGRGQAFGVPDGTLKAKYVAELEDAGFTDIQTFECDAAEYYETYEDLVFLLKYTPIIPDFGQVEGDFEIFKQFIDEHRTSKGIRTNSKRFMVIAKKKDLNRKSGKT